MDRQQEYEKRVFGVGEFKCECGKRFATEPELLEHNEETNWHRGNDH